MPHIISEIELTSGERAALMGGDPKRDPSDSQRLRVRLVFLKWVDQRNLIPAVAAEYSDRKDATGEPVWESADKLPLPIVLAALGQLARDPKRATTPEGGL